MDWYGRTSETDQRSKWNGNGLSLQIWSSCDAWKMGLREDETCGVRGVWRLSKSGEKIDKKLVGSLWQAHHKCL